MTRGSEFLLALLILGPAAAVLVVLVLAGPVGWFLAAFLVLAGMALRAMVGDSEDRTPDRTVCASCGSPSPVENEQCSYCGDPL
jgi:hypothetical protein